MKPRAFLTGGLAVFLALASVASTASAQMSDSERKSAARAAFQEGVALQQQGKVAEALARFQAGEKLYDAPTISLRVAQCQVLLGKLVQGAETYEALVRRNLGPNPTEAFVEAQKQAETELAAVRQRIPTLRVTIKPDASSLSNLHVIENDADVPVELLGIARPINPGVYKLHAVADGWTTTAPVELRVAEKEHKSIELVLVQQTGASATATPTPLPPAYYPTVETRNGTGSSGSSGYTYPTPKPKSSSTGLLLGVRGGVLIPFGKDDIGKPLNNSVRAGPLFGVDGYLRLQNLLLGLNFDVASLGKGSAVDRGNGSRETSNGGSTTYIGASLGLMANVDKTSFIGNVGLGYRSLAIKSTLANGTSTTYDLNSAEVLLDGGIAIPAGPIRIVPKFTLAIGDFGTTDKTYTGTGSSTSDDGRFYMITAFSLGLYYHFDVGKKPPATPTPAVPPANAAPTTPTDASSPPAAAPETTPASSSASPSTT